MSEEKRKLIADQYNKYAKEYAIFAEKSYSWKYIEKPAIDKYLGDYFNEKSKVLEAGCGSGRVINHLISKGIRAENILGSELCEVMIKEARKRTRAKIIQADIANIDLEKDHFDLIICSMVFYYLDPQQLLSTLKNFYQALKVGGTLFYINPHPLRISGGKPLSKDWHIEPTPWGMQSPFFYQEVEDYLFLTRQAGFAIEISEDAKVIPEGLVDKKEYENYSKLPARFIVKARKTKAV